MLERGGGDEEGVGEGEGEGVGEEGFWRRGRAMGRRKGKGRLPHLAVSLWKLGSPRQGPWGPSPWRAGLLLALAVEVSSAEGVSGDGATDPGTDPLPAQPHSQAQPQAQGQAQRELLVVSQAKLPSLEPSRRRRRRSKALDLVPATLPQLAQTVSEEVQSAGSSE